MKNNPQISPYIEHAMDRMERARAEAAFAEIRATAEIDPRHYMFQREQSAHSKLCEWERESSAMNWAKDFGAAIIWVVGITVIWWTLVQVFQ